MIILLQANIQNCLFYKIWNNIIRGLSSVNLESLELPSLDRKIKKNPFEKKGSAIYSTSRMLNKKWFYYQYKVYIIILLINYDIIRNQ